MKIFKFKSKNVASKQCVTTNWRQNSIAFFAYRSGSTAAVPYYRTAVGDSRLGSTSTVVAYRLPGGTI